MKNYIDQLQAGILKEGTAIGNGLAAAVNRLKDSEAKSKIIILLTDGMNNSGYIDPNIAAQMAEEYNIKVYTIGVGTMD
ncbi:MAG: VWA domain-containing protein [Saprospiraceae bacterium]